MYIGTETELKDIDKDIDKDIVDLIKPNSNVLQMFTLMLHAADNSDDWEGHYHYVDLPPHDANTRVVSL